jgi:phosphoadenosine phosphosulfate reductase
MDALADFLSRHERVVLLLSAGKDSAACLKMLRPHLSRVLVAWVNPGSPYPETVQYMSRVQRSVPHFQMVLGHQPQFIARNGYPADVIPFEATPVGRIATRSTGPLLAPLESCCRANLWEPAQRVVTDYGATGCIRGDRAREHLHSDATNGSTRDGVEFFFPVWDWSDQQVYDYLGDEVPPSYKRGLRSSLDCINCTAYLAHNPGRLADLRTHYPAAWAEVGPIIHWMRDAARRHLSAFEEE